MSTNAPSAADAPQIVALPPRAFARLARFGLPAIPRDARAWLLAGDRPLAAAALVNVPGLPGLAELLLAVHPAQRRQGHATRLLTHVAAVAKADGLQRLSVGLDDAHSQPAAVAFLRARGFTPEHRELSLRRALPAALPEMALPADVTFVIGRSRALFTQALALYDDAFRATAWYQPYASAGELRATLGDDHALLFVLHAAQPVGFAALRYMPNAAEIEPLGIAANWQGQGYGRLLLHAVLRELSAAPRALALAEVALWEANTPALRLYTKFGFVLHHSRTYYERALDAEAAA